MFVHYQNMKLTQCFVYFHVIIIVIIANIN